MQADLKRRSPKAREEAQKKGKAGARGNTYHVPREGAGQIVLVAPRIAANRLSWPCSQRAPEVGDYPFTTRNPFPA